MLRVTERADAAMTYANERNAMALLTDVELIPEHCAHGECDGIHWQLTTLRPGVPVNAVWAGLSGDERISLASSAVAQLAELHRIPVPADRLISWTKEAVIDHCNTAPCPDGRLNASEFARIQYCITKLGAGAIAENRLVHGDWHFGNLLCDDMRISGIVDLEWTGRGSFARDLCIGDYFESLSTGAWSIFLPLYAKNSGLDEAGIAEILRWILIWKLYQVSTRRNQISAKNDKKILLELCERIECTDFIPPNSIKSLSGLLPNAFDTVPCL